MKTNSQKAKKEKRDFIIALSIVGIIIVSIISSIFLPDLIEEWKRRASIVDLREEENYITDEHGNKYFALNRSVEATNTDGVYGILNGTEYCFIDFMHEKGKTPLYIVEYDNQVKGTVLRLESAEEITLSGFSPLSADICSGTSDYPMDYFVAPDEYLNNGGNSRNDEEYINLIYSTLTEGNEVSPPVRQRSASRIKLKSQKYPGLYYTVVFITDENGISYLYDIGSGKYVLSPDKLTVRLS